MGKSGGEIAPALAHNSGGDMSELRAELQSAVVQLRAAQSRLSRTVTTLENAGVWSGTDARRFQAAWADEVQRPLLIATAMLDAMEFVPLP